MEIRPFSQCKSSLNFHPINPWARVLPIYSYDSYQLVGFDQTDPAHVVELKGQLEDILLALYPSLSFIELCRLNQVLACSELEYSRIKLFQSWNYRYSQQTQALADAVLRLPLKVQNHLATKNLSPRDLEPLLLNLDFTDIWPRLLEKQASKSELSQLLELIADLKMLNKYPQALNWDLPTSEVIKSLKWARYPHRSAQANCANLKIKKLSWPKNSKYKLETQTDQNVLNVQFCLKSSAELQKLSMQIAKVAEQVMSDEGNDPWQ